MVRSPRCWQSLLERYSKVAINQWLNGAPKEWVSECKEWQSLKSHPVLITQEVFKSMCLCKDKTKKRKITRSNANFWYFEHMPKYCWPTPFMWFENKVTRRFFVAFHSYIQSLGWIFHYIVRPRWIQITGRRDHLVDCWLIRNHFTHASLILFALNLLFSKNPNK